MVRNTKKNVSANTSGCVCLVSVMFYTLSNQSIKVLTALLDGLSLSVDGKMVLNRDLSIVTDKALFSSEKC